MNFRILLISFLAFSVNAMASPKGEKLYELNQVCDIPGTRYSLIMRLTGTETTIDFTPQVDIQFSGTVTLLDGMVRLGDFHGEGGKGYTGKRHYYYFLGENSTKNNLSLGKEHPYIAPTQITLQTDVGGGLLFAFDELDLRCK